MSNLDRLLERNKDVAAQQSPAGGLMPSLPDALPKVKAIVIGCADVRVDPAHVLGFRSEEAVVVRNISLVHDVSTGLVEVGVPPAPFRAA